ncbi:MAG: GAF domain-containing protein [Cyclobacteriaceae bacterium]|nr:GAF domain-containing protein [Cyclobacteriaceae bacterium]MCH8514815.1 GAF domain-containing protein [Cyclobacteriaceae bacterium]
MIKASFHNIRVRLFAAFLSLVVLAAFFILMALWSQRSINDYQVFNDQLKAINSNIQSAKLEQAEFLAHGYQKDAFLTSGNSEEIVQFNALIEEVLDEISILKQSKLTKKERLVAELTELNQSVKSYRINFKEMTDAYLQRGFKDHGLEGEMREYVHALQLVDRASDQVFAFQMRRHEKDFVLRKDMAYVKTMNDRVDAFKSHINNSFELGEIDETYTNQVLTAIDNYHRQFNRLVNLEKTIGLSRSEGIQKRLNDSAQQTISLSSQVSKKLNQRFEEKQRQMNTLLIIASVFLILLGWVFAWVISKRISTPIKTLDAVAKSTSEGKRTAYHQLDGINRKDELGRLAENLKYMLATQEAQWIKINKANESLEQKAKEEELRKWYDQGVNKLADLLKNHYETEEHFGDGLLQFLVKYLGANQGAVYIPSEERTEIECRAAYAFERKKYIKKSFRAGEGLVGACWLEKELIYLTEIPDTYINIRSGLGDTPPRSIILIPCIAEGKIEGIIELASLKIFTKNEIKWLSDIAERIAFFLNSLRSKSQTTKLLAESKEMTEILTQQEEEMRQTLEEMQANQEEESRRSARFEEELNQLKIVAAANESVISKAYEGFLIFDESLHPAYISSEIREKWQIENNKYFTIERLHHTVDMLAIDPLFVASGMSERNHLKCHYEGKCFEVDAVLSKTTYQRENFLIVLIKKDKKEEKEALKRLIKAYF